jgi:hypothetical protein
MDEISKLRYLLYKMQRPYGLLRHHTKDEYSQELISEIGQIIYEMEMVFRKPKEKQT